MFDPGRLDDDHARGGFAPVGSDSGAIPGHEYGLDLTAEEKTRLIAFLRTL